MNFLVLQNNRFFSYLENINSKKLGFSFSFSLHLIILLLALGIPNIFDPKPINIPTIIPIEIINVTQVTSIAKEIKKTKIAEIKKTTIKEKKFNSSDNQDIKKIEIKEKKFNSSDNQDIKKIEIKDKPKVDNSVLKNKISSKEDIYIEEKKETVLKLEKQKIKIDTNNVESLPTKKIKPKLKPKPNQSVKNLEKKLDLTAKINPKPKPVEKKSDIVTKIEPKPKNDVVASVLKDLRVKETSRKIESKIVEKEEEIIDQNQDTVAKENAQLTISEIDLLRQQLSSCWIAPAGSVIKKGMFVKIRANITRERRVFENRVHIHDTNISERNPFYTSITESAMRTLLHPNCTPLKLPEDKYATWKELIITLDYILMGG